ncbi:hypothetical protein RJT34_03334 [Clitoria ternatea]|uniref:Transmembrane protein n=1 Tax=Clitoria ternatea TaxID=43366 RepID=A0AAN9KKL7_CLITE
MSLNLEVLDILKKTAIFYVKNINFIIFTFLASLPFYFVMVYFEILFQKTIAETPEIIPLLPFHEQHYLFSFPIYADTNVAVKSFSKDYLPVLLQLIFIYLAPLHVLELCSSALTVDFASKLLSEENSMSLKDMFKRSIDISILKGTFKTSLYTLFLSSCLLIAFPWTASNCYSFFRVFGSYVFYVICIIALAKLLMMYLEWSAIWNMSIVVSILEGVYGIGALRVSYFFSRGNQRRGLLLMLVFFVLRHCLRLSCVSFRCYKGGYGIFLQIGFLIVVNTLKWVSCLIHYNDCKERKMEKKVDEELGEGLENDSSQEASR